MSGTMFPISMPKDIPGLAYLSQSSTPVARLPYNSSHYEELLRKIGSQMQNTILVKNRQIIDSSRVSQIPTKDTVPEVQKVYKLTINIPISTELPIDPPEPFPCSSTSASSSSDTTSGKKVRKAPSAPLEELPSPLSFFEPNNPTLKKRRFDCGDSTLSYSIPTVSTFRLTAVDSAEIRSSDESQSPLIKKSHFECDDSYLSFPIQTASSSPFPCTDSPKIVYSSSEEAEGLSSQKGLSEYDDSTQSSPISTVSATTIPSLDDVDSTTRQTILQLQDVIEELTEMRELWNSEKVHEADFEIFIECATHFNRVRQKGSPFIHALENVPQAKKIIGSCLKIYEDIREIYYVCTDKFLHGLFIDAIRLKKNKKILLAASIEESCKDIMEDFNQLIGVRKSLATVLKGKIIKETVNRLRMELGFLPHETASSSSSSSSSSVHSHSGAKEMVSF